MNRKIDEVFNVFKRIMTSTEEDGWLASGALSFVLFEYHEDDIESAFFRFTRAERVRLATMLHQLKEEAFLAGMSLKFKSVERGIDSFCLRHFWGYKWLQNFCILLCCLGLWGVGRFFEWSYQEALWPAFCYLCYHLKESSYTIRKQNELLIQELKKGKSDQDYLWLKAQLIKRGWLPSS